MAKKILLVDDDVTLREMYEERLKAEDYEIKTAGNGEEGYQIAKSFMPDLILLDIMMPKVNGFQALEKIKADEATKHIPVFMLTALVQEENKKKAQAAGADGFIVKSETMPREIVTQIKNKLG